MKKRLVLILLVSIGFVHCYKLLASTTSISVDTLTNLIDANAAPFNQIQPGDSILFEPGRHQYILIRNFTGSNGNPIIFINKKGVVSIDTDHYFGISIQNCRFIRLTGTGDNAFFFGFRISRVLNGAGIGVNNLSSDFEIDHVSIENTSIGGIYAKTDPDCSFASTRGSFTQFNTAIHDNFLANIGNEGMYIGSTKYFGQTVNCDGKDTLLFPGLLAGVRIYNNIIKYTGWDGIQVSSASSDCQVYNNLVMYDSQDEYFGQMAGIMLGGGSKCDCYNNYISNGKGNGIESHGLGGYRIFNNVIVEAGRTYHPLDTSMMKYGIYVTDISVQADSSFTIIHNDIINPKSDGIRFISVLSKNNLIASNVIINPGTYDYYDLLHTSFTGEDSYVMIPDSTSKVLISSNYFSRNADNAGFAETNFTLLENSPLIDAGYPDTRGVGFDGYHNPRIYANAPDIGVYEYNPLYLNIHSVDNLNLVKPMLFPNPVKTELTFRFQYDSEAILTFGIYNLHGERVIYVNRSTGSGGNKEIIVNVDSLPPGIYIYQLNVKGQTDTGKFIKVN
jgi:hypothetical protein